MTDEENIKREEIKPNADEKLEDKLEQKPEIQAPLTGVTAPGHGVGYFPTPRTH